MKSSYRIQSGFRASLLGRVLFHRVFLLGLVFAVLGGTAVVGGRWAYGKWMNRQSWKFAAEAAEYRSQGRVSEALMCAKTALRLNPDNPGALRELARLSAATEARRESLKAWERLAGTGVMTQRDLVEYVMLAGAEGEWEVVRRILDRMSAVYPGADVHLLRSKMLDAQGDRAGAEAELRAAVALDKGPRSRMALALILLDRGNDRLNGAEILNLLREVGRDGGTVGALALASGLERGVVPAGELPEWVASLRSHPRVNCRQLLIADTAELSINKGVGPLVAARVYSRCKPRLLPERRGAFLWLCRNGGHVLALKLVKPHEALVDEEFFKAWLDACGSQRQFEMILGALENPNLPISPLMAGLYRSRTIGLARGSAEGHGMLKELLASHTDDPASMREAIQYLLGIREEELLDFELGKILSAHPAMEGLGYADLLPLIASGRDMERLMRFNRLAASHDPANPVVLNELDYAALILNGRVDVEELGRRAGRNPTNVGMQTVLALAYLEDGMPAKAQGALLAVRPGPGTPPLEAARHSFVQALVHAAGGDKEAFRKTLSSIERVRLSRQEMARLQRAWSAMVGTTPGAGFPHGSPDSLESDHSSRRGPVPSSSS